MTKRLLNTQKIINLSTDPASGVAGEVYFNTTSNILKVYSGSSWAAIGGGSSLPSQTGNNGKYLKTDGTNASWSLVDADTLDGQHGSYYAPLASPTFTGVPAAPTAVADTNTTQLATTAFVIGQGYLKSATASSTYQPLDADLTAIAGLTGTSGLLKKTAADTWTLDTTAYTTNTGTVTSVTMTVPTGLSISGTPITTSGTLALTLSAGYSIPTTSSQTNWDTAYTDRNKWDGGATGLVAATGRTSLGLGTMATETAANYALLASPTFTGVPAAPTATAGTNTTQIATTEFVQTAVNTTTINTQTASYQLVLADAGDVVEMNVASANNLTVPLNSAVAYPIGTSIDIVQYGAGQTTIVPASGVTIRSNGSKLKLTGQYSAATLYKRGTDEWVIMGDLSA